MGNAADSYIRERGGELLLGKQVASLLLECDHVEGVKLNDGSLIRGDAYISSLPFDTLETIIPLDQLGSDDIPFFQKITGLSSAPIVNVHLWYDRWVMNEEFIAFVDHPIQWIFNKNRIQDLNDDESGSGGLREDGLDICNRNGVSHIRTSI